MVYSRNPDWYRAKHALAVELVNWSKGPSDGKEMLLKRAEECVQDLLREADATLQRNVWGRRASSERELRRFLRDDIKPAAQVLLTEIDAAKRSLRDGADPGEATATARAVSAENSLDPDINYALARLAAQNQALFDATKYLQVVVGSTARQQWPGLAHRIVRDPVLTAFAASSSLDPAGEFRAYIDEAREEARAQAEAKAQTQAQVAAEAQVMEARDVDAPAAEAEDSDEDAPPAGLD